MKAETSLQDKDDDELKLMNANLCTEGGIGGMERVVLYSGYFILLFF